MVGYKSFLTKSIGSSDYAALIAVGCGAGGLTSRIINFGGDGDYDAYIVPEEAEVGEHYKAVAEFENWVRIYDDTSMSAKFEGSKITIYRAGKFGCIIKVWK